MYIELTNICKSFGNFKACDQVSFGVRKGSLSALLGPSGSGKTTILRMIAGLAGQDSGDIYIDGRLVNDIPVYERNIGFVFQSYALFPYMTVYENIAYGLKAQGKRNASRADAMAGTAGDKAAIRNRVLELLELVGLSGLEHRYPEQLSGGQKQRVAFARALAPNPRLLLLDEPFAAIDAKVRGELRLWLKEMIAQIGVTSIFVTHDQEEAVEIADQIIVTNQGRVEQTGTADEIYKNPRTAFVARFIGESFSVKNYEKLRGFEGYADGKEAIARPEFIKVIPMETSRGVLTEARTAEVKACRTFGDRLDDSSFVQTERSIPDACEYGIVKKADFRGSFVDLLVDIHGTEIKARQSLAERPLQAGDEVCVLIDRIFIIDEECAFAAENALLSGERN